MILEPKIGDKYLITTDNYFIAPNGLVYYAVFGTIHGIHDDADTLSIKTNEESTNWYLSIGNMTVAGCQIHYAIKTDSVSFKPSWIFNRIVNRIYNADD